MPFDPLIAYLPASGNAAGADGIDDWFVPSQAPNGANHPHDRIVPWSPETDAFFPDDWIYPDNRNAPPPAPTPSTAAPAPSPQPNAANPAISNRPAPPADPFAAYWAMIPASRAGAMAWQPPIFLPPDPFAPENIPASKWLTPLPIFLGDSPTFSPNNSTTSVWPPAPSPLAGGPDAWPSGGILGALANLGSSSPGPGGLLGALAHLGSSSPAAAGSFPSPPPPQSANVTAVSPTARRPVGDYSAGEIAGDAAKSFGVGMGTFAVHSAGFLGDAREMLANGAQRAADYLAPGSAPNAGSKVSEFLATYPGLAGPTSSQLQSAVESYTGPFYQPKTIVGDYAETAGEFVPGALLMPEAGLARGVLRYGLLPALSSETAGQLTKDTPAEPWARIAGAVLGAPPNPWRDLPQPRSAVNIAETTGTFSEGKLSPAEELAARRRAQLEVNKAAGAEFENKTAGDLEQSGANFARQITLETQSGLQTRMDFLSRSPGAREIRCIECKASETARETANQKKAFKEIVNSGATIVGAGKPGYGGGMKIPATNVEILRP